MIFRDKGKRATSCPDLARASRRKISNLVPLTVKLDRAWYESAMVAS